MPPSPEPIAAAAPWVHALWGQSVQVAPLQAAPPAAAPGRPVLSGRADGERVLHLPASPGTARPTWVAAAGAHAAAHWRFGGPSQPRAGLKPVQLALAGVLEDARVEALAVRELPGLRGLWLPFHLDDAPQGLHFAALLARLGHVLLDPRATDPHPWVVRVRRLVGGQLEAIAPEQLRRLASSLGNEAGQMRLPFNPVDHQVHAAYRDDNHHLWDEDRTLPPSDQLLAAGQAQEPAGGGSPSLPRDPGRVRLHPEWDDRIGRVRRDWVRVLERDAPQAAAAAPDHQPRSLSQGLLRALQAQGAAGRRRTSGRSTWGDDFHPAALVDARLRQRLREPVDERIYRAALAAPRTARVLLLVDASASTADTAGGRPLLARLLAVAQAGSHALERVGHRSAVLAFRSDGRHRVDLLHLKHWQDEARAPAVLRREAALRPGGSTRTGAAVRHAAELLGRPDAAIRRIVLLTDGAPHDVDVPHPRYLAQDLRRAIADARRSGIEVRTVPLPLALHPGGSAGSLARLLAG